LSISEVKTPWVSSLTSSSKRYRVSNVVSHDCVSMCTKKDYGLHRHLLGAHIFHKHLILCLHLVEHSLTVTTICWLSNVGVHVTFFIERFMPKLVPTKDTLRVRHRGPLASPCSLSPPLATLTTSFSWNKILPR
jgi:hypothetical protein